MNTSISAQIRRDAVWCFGDSVQIDFNQSPPVISNCAIRTRGTACSITDSLGQLLFYCQTAHRINFVVNDFLGAVFNSQNQLMDNGDSLVGDGWYHEMQIIPNPANANQYYILHSGVTVNPELYYSLIDMTYNGGLGKVILKNVLLNNFNGEYVTDGLAAIKHGNGKDWWLLFKTYNDVNDTIHRYLISDQGISTEMIQRIGVAPFAGFLRLFFNNAGTKMVIVSASGLLEYYDFDRCTGLLSNRIQINPESQIPADFFWSAAFSPNDSVLYVTVDDTLNCLYQYNLFAPNISNTRQLLYSFNFPYYGSGDLRTSIDGKIYYSIAFDNGIGFNFPYADTTYNSINMNLSVINQPNLLGAACDFQPYSFYLGGFRTYVGIGINPNYDLGPLTGSACDSLSNSISDLLDVNSFSIYPNPASNHFTFFTDMNVESSNYIELFDLSGRIILKQPIHENTINTEQIPDGFYLLKLFQNNRLNSVLKIQIIH